MMKSKLSFGILFGLIAASVASVQAKADATLYVGQSYNLPECKGYVAIYRYSADPRFIVLDFSNVQFCSIVEAIGVHGQHINLDGGKLDGPDGNKSARFAVAPIGFVGFSSRAFNVFVQSDRGGTSDMFTVIP